jgi:endonuclease/exonuclease/phosphatase family metal-dependent hydrolase
MPAFCNRLLVLIGCLALPGYGLPASEILRIATFNVENYVDKPSRGRQLKSSESKAKIVESIRALSPDVIALQEIGSKAVLEELQGVLASAGMKLPHSEFAEGADPNIHVAVLSRFPITESRSHRKESFLLHGRRFHVSRGIVETDIKVNEGYAFTLMAVHLKSRLASAEADEGELRLEEAKILREKIEQLLADKPQANVVVVGDFNDSRDSVPLRTVLGRGKTRLVDTRPAERSETSTSLAGRDLESRSVTWTHHYMKEDSYTRVDYILLSTGMAREWQQEGTYVLAMPGWGVASDHRPLVAAFEARDK